MGKDIAKEFNPDNIWEYDSICVTSVWAYNDDEEDKPMCYQTEWKQRYAFTTTYDGKTSHLVNEGMVIVNNVMIPVRALWDTGAEFSCITKKFAKRLGVEPKSEMEIAGAVGHGAKPTYEMDVVVLNVHNFSRKSLVEIDFDKDYCDIVIGMDIISQGDFAVTERDGKTIFSFRYPHMRDIDFTDDALDENWNLKE